MGNLRSRGIWEKTKYRKIKCGKKDISAKDPAAEFQPSDFQDDLDSTIFVRERTKGSKLEPSFEKKTGKIMGETEHTVAILPESTKWAKTYSKRDFASASNAQKKRLKKTVRKKRAFLSDSSSSSEAERPQKRRVKKGVNKTPEIALELEEDQRPAVIEITSGTTESVSRQEDKQQPEQGTVQEKGKEQFPKIEQNAENAATTKTSIVREPTRVLERVRRPTLR